MIDILLGGTLGLSTLAAARNGITKELVRIASLIVAVLASMWGYGLLAGELEAWMPNARIAAIASFGAIFVGCLLAGALVGVLLSQVWSLSGLGWVDTLLGAGFGLVRGLLVCMALVLVLVGFQPFPSVTRALAQSSIAPFALSLGKTAVLLGPKVFRDAYSMGTEAVELMTQPDHGDPADGEDAPRQET